MAFLLMTMGEDATRYPRRQCLQHAPRRCQFLSAAPQLPPAIPDDAIDIISIAGINSASKTSDGVGGDIQTRAEQSGPPSMSSWDNNPADIVSIAAKHCANNQLDEIRSKQATGSEATFGHELSKTGPPSMSSWVDHSQISYQSLLNTARTISLTRNVDRD